MKTLESWKLEALRAANDLLYPDSVKQKILAAKTEREVSQIMANARHKSL